MNIKTVYSVAIISSAFVWNLALANPEGGQIAAGLGTINQSNSQTVINQNSQSMVINWKGFDTKANETVGFNQPNANAVALNRINSGLPTSFAGSLTANGKVFIINQAGVVFVGGSHVTTSGLVVSTTDIKDQDFMKGNYHFMTASTKDNASIINNGTLKADNSGVVALIAPNVVNSQTGLIQADYGKVVLASGKAFVVDFNQDSLINFDVGAAVRSGNVVNAGAVSAQGGKVFMTANAVTQVLDSLANSGNTSAAISAVVSTSGNIILSGKVNASQVNLDASTGIDISAPVTALEKGFTATTETGNININNIIDAGNADVSLTASQGVINETGMGGIKAGNLATDSFSGTSLNSADNAVSAYSARNLLTGNISLNNNHDLNVGRIFQNGGDLSITNSGSINQSESPADFIKVTGKSSFTSKEQWISLASDNNFMGAVNLSAPRFIKMANSSHNIVLDNVSTDDNLVIQNTAGSITQAANGIIKVKNLSVSTEDAPITLNNPGNQISGYIRLENSKYSNQNISLNNSLNTYIDAITAGGLLTITSTGKLDITNSITSFATDAPNGHSIVISVEGISSRLYKQAGMVNAGENNSYLVYLQNPNEITSSLVFGSLDMPSEIWETPYVNNGPEAISTGNHLIYADKKPATP